MKTELVVKQAELLRQASSARAATSNEPYIVLADPRRTRL
jgi:hypothetical protein